MICRFAPKLLFILLLSVKAFAQNDSANKYHFFYVEPTYNNSIEPKVKYSGAPGISFGFEFVQCYKKSWGTEWGIAFSQIDFKSPDYLGYLSVGPHNTYYNSGYGHGPPVPLVNVHDEYSLSLLEFPFLIRKEFDMKFCSDFMSLGPLATLGRLHTLYYNPGEYSNEESGLIAALGFQTILGSNLKIKSGNCFQLAVKADARFVSKSVHYDTRRKVICSVGFQLVFPFNPSFQKTKRETHEKEKKSDRDKIKNGGNDSLSKFTRNSFYLEIFGPGGFGSLNFERMIFHNLNHNFRIIGRVGAGFIDAPVVVFGPEFLFGMNNFKFETGAGFALGPGNRYFHVDLGLRYSSAKGFLLRATFTPIVTRQELQPFGGLSIGKNF